MFGIFKALRLKPVSDASISDSIAETLASGWTKRYYATDANDNPVSYISNDATNFCALAAIYRIFIKNDIDIKRQSSWLLEFYDYLNSSPRFTDVLPTDRVMGKLRIMEWNESEAQTQQNVVATFRDYAAYLRSRPDHA